MREDLAIIRLVAWREVVSRRKAFLVTTAIVAVVALALVGMAAFLARADDGPVRVGVVGSNSEELQRSLTEAIGSDHPVEVVVVADQAEAERRLEDGDLDAGVIGPLTVRWGRTTPGFLVEALTSVLRRSHIETVAGELGLGVVEAERLAMPVRGMTVGVEEAADVGAQVVSVVSVILMFVAILSYGQWIAYGVVEEKSNRVVELLVGVIRPHHLLAAKVVSIGAMGLIQLVVVGGLAIGFGVALDQFALPPVTGSTLAWLVVWFLLGYAFYGCVYAAAGSLAADTSEAGTTIGPLNILPGLGYMIGLIAFSGVPANALIRVLSFVPPWAPLVMPGRIAKGWVEPWEIAVSVVVMLVSTYAAIRLAGRVYLGGVTQASRTLGWREALRAGEDVGRGDPRHG